MNYDFYEVKTRDESVPWSSWEVAYDSYNLQEAIDDYKRLKKKIKNEGLELAVKLEKWGDPKWDCSKYVD